MSKRRPRKKRVISSNDSEDSCSDSLRTEEQSVPLRKRTKHLPSFHFLSFLDSESEDEENLSDTSWASEESGQENSSEATNLSSNVSWCKENLNPIIHNFDASNSGCKATVDSRSTALDYFEVFFSNETVALIAEKTNRYHNYLTRKKCAEKSRLRLWCNTTVEEIYCFLAITLLMTRVKKLSYAEYWSMDALIKTDIFNSIMPRDRYVSLLKCLYFSDPNEGQNELFEMRPLIDRFRESFRSSFCPYQHIRVDSSLLLFKSRLSLKQFLSLKRNRCGFKSFALCDCKSGYVLDFFVYSTKEILDTYDGLGRSGKIVMYLLKPYLEKGHTLFVEERYTSPTLFNLLHEKGTNACGVANKSRKDMPSILEKPQSEEIAFRSSKNMLCLKWQAKKETWMLTTCHSADLVDTGQINRRVHLPQRKPTCVLDYGRSMGTIDKTSMVVCNTELIKRNYKWYKRYFFHMLDMAVWNAYVLHRHENGVELKFPKFQLTLIRELLSKYLKCADNGTEVRKNSNSPLRLSERHFPSFYRGNTVSKKGGMRKCVVCTRHGKRRESRYHCENCDVGLCIVPCFKIYHTVYDY